VDDSSSKDGSRAGLIIETHQGERPEHVLKFMFKASNNKTEYEDLIAGIEVCYMVGANSVRAFSHS